MSFAKLFTFWRMLGCVAILTVGVAAPLGAQQPPGQAAPGAQPAAPAAAPAAAQPATPAVPPKAAPPSTSAPPSSSVSTEELQRLVATLQSDTDRARLVAQLQALIDAQRQVQQQPGLLTVIITSVSNGISQMTDTLSDAGSQLADLSGLWRWLTRAANDTDLRARLIEAVVRIAGVLGCGLLALVATYLLLGRLASRVLKRLPANWGGKLAGAALTFFIHAAPLAAFAAATFVAMPFLLARLQLHLNEVIVAAVNAVLITGLLVALGRAILQPAAPHVRILNWSDETTAYADVWLRRFVLTAVIGYMALETASLFGLPHSAHNALQRLLGLLICGLLAVAILQNRHTIAKWLKTTRRRSDAPLSSLRLRLAENWHILAILYVLFVYVIWLLHPAAGLEFLLRDTFLTALILVLALVLLRALERLLGRVLAVGKDVKARFPAVERRANRYLSIVFTLVRVAVAIVVLLVVLRIWGFDSFSLVVDQPGRQILGGVLRIIAIVIGAMALWEMGGVALQRYLERNGKSGRLGQARVKTMLPVARNLLGMTILVLAALMLLSEIGVAIGPLLAGAGIVGLALGLGAQNLVKDLIGGFSLIMEDAVAVGDVVKIGDNSGVVEQLSIRWLRLRDANGTVHYIPLGSVSVVENLTKDFAFAPISLKVQYGTRLDDVVKAINDVGDDMVHDTVFADQILAPVEIFGLDKFADGAYIVTGRIKTRPGAQWNVGREFNKRLKATLDERKVAVNPAPPTMALGQDVIQALQQLRGDQPTAAADQAAPEKDPLPGAADTEPPPSALKPA